MYHGRFLRIGLVLFALLAVLSAPPVSIHAQAPTPTLSAGDFPSPCTLDLAGEVVFNDDFSTDPNLNPNWDIHRYDPQSTAGSGVWDDSNQTFFLTTHVYDQGIAMFAHYDLPRSVWLAQFRYRISDNGADGLVFTFYKNKYAFATPQAEGYGGALGFQFNYALRGIIGYGIEFDTWQNPSTDFSGADGDPSESHIALINSTVSNHLLERYDSRTDDGAWHTACVAYGSGFVGVWVDGDEVLHTNLSNPNTWYSGFGFSAGTGSVFADHEIDDFSLKLLTLPSSFAPLDQAVAQDTSGYMYLPNLLVPPLP